MTQFTSTMPGPKTLCQLTEAALAAVAPDGAVLRSLKLQGDTLSIQGKNYNLAAYKRIFVLGAGKGAAPMAEAVEKLLGARITDGLIIVKYDHALPLKHIRLAEAAHPVPDQAGYEAAHEIVRMAKAATAEDLIIFLFTGGASALTPALWEGISLGDMQKLTGLLLECGATIHEINALRKHLSVFSGGRLAQAGSRAQAMCLIVSDVVGDNLDVIGSGPTVPDMSHFADCAAILDKFLLWDKVPPAIAAHLRAGMQGLIPETPKQGDVAFARMQNVLVATISQALDAAAASATADGCEVRIVQSDMTGEAREQGARLVNIALEAAKTRAKGSKPLCILAGGETTVTLKGKGLGGRNQEMALQAAILLDGHPGISMVCVGTDGTDGPTDAAGGVVDGTSAAKARELGLDLAAYLAENDSYHALERIGALLKTGPTRTNVMDMVAVLVAAD